MTTVEVKVNSQSILFYTFTALEVKLRDVNESQWCY